MITIDYFKKEPIWIYVPEQSAGIPQDVATNELQRLETAIEFYEEEYLTYLLGSELYEEFIATFDDVKWDYLKALLVNEDKLRSPIANYIYCKYIYSRQFESTNGIRWNATKSDNVEQVSIFPQYSKAWNKMVEWNNKLFKYLLGDFSDVETTAELDYSAWESECLNKKETWL